MSSVSGCDSKREKSVFEYVSKKEILHCAKNLICAEVFDPQSLIKKIIVCQNKFVVHKHKVFGLCFSIFFFFQLKKGNSDL